MNWSCYKKYLFFSLLLFSLFLNNCNNTTIYSHYSELQLHEQKNIQENANFNIIKTEGKIKLYKTFGDDYKVYFHIPIKLKNQLPIYIEVYSPNLINYSFIKTSEPNVLAVAKMRGKSYFEFFNMVDTLKWVAYTLTSDILNNNDIQSTDDIHQWLKPSNCVQFNDIDLVLDSFRVNKDSVNVNKLLDFIGEYKFKTQCYKENKLFYDAFSTSKWGSTCTGLTNFSIACFRLLDIPARAIILIPTFSNDFIDMHWNVQYWFQNSWVNYEPLRDANNYNTSKDVIMYLCYLEDEFPKFGTSGIQSSFYTSDNRLGDYNPNWSSAHKSTLLKSFYSTPDSVKLLFDNFNLFYNYFIINNSIFEKNKFQYNDYLTSVKSLLDADIKKSIIVSSKINDTIRNKINIQIDTIYFDDLDSIKSWNFGSYQDKFKLFRDSTDFNEYNNCLGYEVSREDKQKKSISCESPLISIPKSQKTILQFKVWSLVDIKKNIIVDPFWVEIIQKNKTKPVCKNIGGGNQYNEIPSYGGWSTIYLDISEYSGSEIKIKFNFS